MKNKWKQSYSLWIVQALCYITCNPRENILSFSLKSNCSWENMWNIQRTFVSLSPDTWMSHARGEQNEEKIAPFPFKVLTNATWALNWSRVFLSVTSASAGDTCIQAPSRPPWSPAVIRSALTQVAMQPQSRLLPVNCSWKNAVPFPCTSGTRRG